MGRTGSTHEGEATYIHIYRGVGGVGEDLGVDGDNIKEDFQKKTGCDDVDLLRQVQDRDKLLLWAQLHTFNFYRMRVLY